MEYLFFLQIVEESEMWKDYYKMKEFEKDSRNSFLQDKRADMRDEFSSRGDKRAHMDDEPETFKSTVCMRKLYKTEEEDPDRFSIVISYLNS